jgi:hypothetical protein
MLLASIGALDSSVQQGTREEGDKTGFYICARYKKGSHARMYAEECIRLELLMPFMSSLVTPEPY